MRHDRLDRQALGEDADRLVELGVEAEGAAQLEFAGDGDVVRELSPSEGSDRGC
ncbi:hypothetical protein ACH5A2_36400 [Streptomyces collinus]|uniref:hypothetical protein n=1 Tax=Streptomyces collinus TaxID=42684 RepID=UPI003796F8B7